MLLDNIASVCCRTMGLTKVASPSQHNNTMWAEMCREAARHGVLPVLLAAYMGSGNSTDEVMLPWVAQTGLLECKLRQNVAAAKILSTIFHEAGLDILFIKGLSLNQYWPQPQWRVSSDIDYYLYGRSSEGVEVLSRAGIASHGYYHHHTRAEMDGVLLENHYDFFDRRSHRSNRMLDDAMKQLAAEEGRSRYMDGLRGAYRMTPTMNALFLLRHMSAHFASETLTLRMLFDWILFLRQESEEVDWQLVTKLYKESGLVPFAAMVMSLVESKLGVCSLTIPGVQPDDRHVERAWQSMAAPNIENRYRKGSLRYQVREGQVFLRNRWKHDIVYAGESFATLAVKYAISLLTHRSNTI